MLKRWFQKATLAGIGASLLLIVLSSCSSNIKANQITPVPSPTPATNSPIPAGKPANPIKQVTIDAQVTDDTIVIPLANVTANLNTRFKLATDAGEMTFMAYIWDGKLDVRADICPPCRSRSFTLYKGTLVCDACGTVFDAENGQGIKGACVAYPKESAAYQLSGDNIVVEKADLVTAYKNTLTAN